MQTPDFDIDDPHLARQISSMAWTQADNGCVSAPRKLIGEMLIDAGLIRPEQLEAALNIQTCTGERIGDILVKEGALTRAALHRKLAEQWVIGLRECA